MSTLTPVSLSDVTNALARTGTEVEPATDQINIDPITVETPPVVQRVYAVFQDVKILLAKITHSITTSINNNPGANNVKNQIVDFVHKNSYYIYAAGIIVNLYLTPWITLSGIGGGIICSALSTQTGFESMKVKILKTNKEKGWVGCLLGIAAILDHSLIGRVAIGLSAGMFTGNNIVHSKIGKALPGICSDIFGQISRRFTSNERSPDSLWNTLRSSIRGRHRRTPALV
jgi:hypothetical protein